MAKNYIQEGMDITVPAPSGGVTSGSVVVIGRLVGVAAETAAVGVPVTLSRTGVFTLPKTSAQAWTVGQAINWDASTGVATTATTTGFIPIGFAAAVAANPSATGLVCLTGTAVAAL